MSRRAAIWAAATLLLLWGWGGTAWVLADGWRVLWERPPGAALALSSAHELIISGENRSAAPTQVWLRLDDGASRDYGTRVNRVLKLPPGPFRMRIAVGGLRTPAGRLLDLRDLRYVSLFQKSADPLVLLRSAEFVAAAALPHGVYAWDFGPADSAVFPGFSAVAPDDPRLHGPAKRGVQRSSGDALIGDGIAGIEQFRVRVHPGNWRLTLWLDDLGEWEYVPHDLARRVSVNGKVIFEEQRTPTQWLREVYLGRRDAEALFDGDPWQLFGAQRGVPITRDIELSGEELVLALAGATPTARYLAAALLEPREPGDVVQGIQAQRAERFRERWRVADAALAAPVQRLTVWALPAGETLQLPARPGAIAATLARSVTAGVAFSMDAAVLAPVTADERPRFWLRAPQDDTGVPLQTELRVGQWYFQRDQNLLTVRSDYLRADLHSPRLHSQIPRRINLWMRVPADAPAGVYRGELRVQWRAEEAALPLTVNVLPLTLPEAGVPVGVYLQSPPQLAWFSDLARQRDAGLACDLAYLRQMGLTGVAPPLTTPVAGKELAFVKDLASAQLAGLSVPYLAYTPVKELLKQGRDATLRQIIRVSDGLREAAIAPPLWSIADEPSNPGPGVPDPLRLAALLKAAVPEIRLAGHLNHPDDERFLPAFDVALINPGFGVDPPQLRALRARGVEPWLYNMAQRRLAAGFFLWRSGAAGYLQWHARMPTADPFDPTDGREGDYQMLYPSLAVCDGLPDINAALLEITDGITDLRWLRWLESRASKERDAQALLAELQGEVPARWDEAVRLGAEAPERWRERIIELAVRRNAAQQTSTAGM